MMNYDLNKIASAKAGNNRSLDILSIEDLKKRVAALDAELQQVSQKLTAYLKR
jgi:uncharacterized small protein (DUF1192 family)